MKKAIIIIVVISTIATIGYFIYMAAMKKKKSQETTSTEVISEDVRLLMENFGYTEEEATQIFNSPLYAEGKY